MFSIWPDNDIFCFLRLSSEKKNPTGQWNARVTQQEEVLLEEEGLLMAHPSLTKRHLLRIWEAWDSFPPLPEGFLTHSPSCINQYSLVPGMRVKCPKCLARESFSPLLDCSKNVKHLQRTPPPAGKNKGDPYHEASSYKMVNIMLRN